MFCASKKEKEKVFLSLFRGECDDLRKKGSLVYSFSMPEKEKKKRKETTKEREKMLNSSLL